MNQVATIPPEREGHAPPADLAERRAMMAGAAGAGHFATKRPAVEETVGGVRTLRVSPEGGKPSGYLLMLHGGGYRLGLPEQDAAFAERLADRCNVEVVLPAYRVAPEGPFPAGLNDALTALKGIAARAGNAPILVGGDSAGGGLAASLAVHCAAAGTPKIAGAVLLSPWVDLTVEAKSYKDNAASDPLFSEEAATTASGLYLQGLDPRHPLASALFADLAGFPPAYVNAGTGETLRDDAVAFHQKLEAAGGTSRLHLIPDMEHVAVCRGTDLVGSAESLEAIVAFIDGILASG